MDFVTSIKTCLQKYADFEGRASRPEFWWFALFCVLVNILGGVIFAAWINSLIGLALVVPSVAVGARRLHDLGKTGWLQLLWLIPLIGWAILIYWGAQPGEPGTNKFGPPPADSPVVTSEIAPGQQ